MGMGELQTCDECGQQHDTVRDLGSRQPLALCEGCMAGAVRAWTGSTPRPLTTSEVQAAVGAGMDLRMLRRRLEVAREADSGSAS
ncbi:hypothetical protein [Streptomyces sp. Wb2n-11]|uniref:hypothetical protein n=1 Tax=Streptomyces sp. Wb2n-11 TaxID=1030533 RepID=UPI000AE538E0|nr:hypothetical protein [Streptomyces sp. Wb2n-11]